ncbi:MAG: glycosyltransferase [Hyphomicrobiales bacterium]
MAVAEELRAKVDLHPRIKLQITPLKSGIFRGWTTNHHLPLAVYLRLLLADSIDASKVVYVDSDTLVLKDLTQLFAIDLGDSMLAGVPDPGGEQFSRVPRHEGDPYLNSGVLVMNLDLMRRDGFLAKCESIHDRYGRALTWQDQCILNKYAEGRKIALPAMWNRLVQSNSLSLSETEQAISADQSAIVHFVSVVKPWQEWCNPIISRFWWRYARESGVAGLTPQKIQRLEQAISLANACDQIEMYETASNVKSEIIRKLLARQKTH